MTETGPLKEPLPSGSAVALADEIERIAKPKRNSQGAAANGGDHREICLSVPDIKCGACVANIEKHLSKQKGVHTARVNLARKQLSVIWKRTESSHGWLKALDDIGQRVVLPGDPAAQTSDTKSSLTPYLRAMAVAGFASANIMMLSVGVWSGADESIRHWLHVLSAFIAIPAIAYSGRIFFVSALQALRLRSVNMDVPISVGVLAIVALGVYDVWANSEHVYFESAVMLIFFLLIGRTLEHAMRERASRVAGALEQSLPRGAYQRQPDGSFSYVLPEQLNNGDVVRVEADQTIPVDGLVTEGHSQVDTSLMTGESQAMPTGPGSTVHAGTRNLDSTMLLSVRGAGSNTTLAHMVEHVRTMESSPVVELPLAEKAVKFYAPFVHVAALITGVAWLLLTQDWHLAISVAVSVLIITCPCAFGLAVPMVQTMASQHLFKKGILLLTSDALEKLTQVRKVVFDKTGTLTQPSLGLLGNQDNINRTFTIEDKPVTAQALLHALASQSSHPLAAATINSLSTNSSGSNIATPEDNLQITGDTIHEVAGCGISASLPGLEMRLGKPGWAGRAGSSACRLVFSVNKEVVAEFGVTETLVEDCELAFKRLRAGGYGIEMLSGDTESAVAEIAGSLDVSSYAAAIDPLAKSDRVSNLQLSGQTILYVGDGLNDLPALATADVAMVPGGAADIGRSAADIVYTRNSLQAVPDVIQLSGKAFRLMKQNLWFSSAYNLLAIPAAALGLITPLWAAIAMSLSSLVVIGNSMRLASFNSGEGSDRAPVGQSAIRTTDASTTAGMAT